MTSRFLETIKEEDPRFGLKKVKKLVFENCLWVWLLRSRASKPSSEIVYAAEQGDIDRVERILKIMPHMVNRKAFINRNISPTAVPFKLVSEILRSLWSL